MTNKQLYQSTREERPAASSYITLHRVALSIYFSIIDVTLHGTRRRAATFKLCTIWTRRTWKDTELHCIVAYVMTVIILQKNLFTSFWQLNSDEIHCPVATNDNHVKQFFIFEFETTFTSKFPFLLKKVLMQSQLNDH